MQINALILDLGVDRALFLYKSIFIYKKYNKKKMGKYCRQAN